MTLFKSETLGDFDFRDGGVITDKEGLVVGIVHHRDFNGFKIRVDELWDPSRFRVRLWNSGLRGILPTPDKIIDFETLLELEAFLTPICK